jgi:hypothetical protein
MPVLDLTIGPPIQRGPLTLFPLVRANGAASAVPAARYDAGPTAADQGLIEVKEKDIEEVAELVVDNLGTRPVLLIEGECVVGAKQNRTLNVSVLVPVGPGMVIPVSCIEAGRWGTENVTLRSTRHAPGTLRASKTRSVNRSVRASGRHTSNQGQVWREVDEYLEAFGTVSQSAALEDVFEASSISVDELVDGLSPVDGQVGLVSACGGQIRSFDLFDQPATLLAYWDALVQGAALDALARPELAEAPVLAEAQAQQFVDDVIGAEWERTAGVGLGRSVSIDTPTVTATGVEWDGVVCHLAAFASESDDNGPNPTRSSRPIRRGLRPHGA